MQLFLKSFVRHPPPFVAIFTLSLRSHQTVRGRGRRRRRRATDGQCRSLAKVWPWSSSSVSVNLIASRSKLCLCVPVFDPLNAFARVWRVVLVDWSGSEAIVQRVRGREKPVHTERVRRTEGDLLQLQERPGTSSSPQIARLHLLW